MLQNPSHPGQIIRDEVLPRFNMSKSAAARVLNYDRATLHRVLEGDAAVTAELALKIEKAFGVDAGLLVNVQTNWDLANTRRRIGPVLDQIERQVVPAG